MRLHFAEIWFNSPNQRQFNVDINGQRVLTNFDIFAQAGAKDKAIVEEFAEAADSGGAITINFTSGTYNVPQVNGIELIPAGGG